LNTPLITVVAAGDVNTDKRLAGQFLNGALSRYSSPVIAETLLEDAEETMSPASPAPPPRTKQLRRRSCFAAINDTSTAIQPCVSSCDAS